MSPELIHTLGVLASIYLLFILLVVMAALAAVLFASMRLVGALRRRLENALRKAQGAAQAVERGATRTARVAVSPVVFSHRIGATTRALWRRVAGPVRAWRGAR